MGTAMTSAARQTRCPSDVAIDCLNLAEARRQLKEFPGHKAALAVQKLKRVMDENARAVRAGFFVVR